MGFKKLHLLLVLWPSRAAGCQTGLVEPEILNPGQVEKACFVLGQGKKEQKGGFFPENPETVPWPPREAGVLEVTQEWMLSRKAEETNYTTPP